VICLGVGVHEFDCYQRESMGMLQMLWEDWRKSSIKHGMVSQHCFFQQDITTPAAKNLSFNSAWHSNVCLNFHGLLTSNHAVFHQNGDGFRACYHFDSKNPWSMHTPTLLKLLCVQMKPTRENLLKTCVPCLGSCNPNRPRNNADS
jgi:hypothetical protein